jgi:hypothetical protein
MAVLKQKCSNGHAQSWHCHSGPAPGTCSTCERERKEAEKKAQKALKNQMKRDEQTQKHLKEVAKVQEEIDQITQSMKDAQLDSEQKAVLAQKKQDLAAAKELAKKKHDRLQEESARPKQSETESPATSSGKPAMPSASSNLTSGSRQKLQEQLKACIGHNKSPSKTEWQRQKDQEYASNPAIDQIMEMIGLEEVKSKVLQIKARVETSIRQGTDLKKERLGLVLLGNPGAGKTSFLE